MAGFTKDRDGRWFGAWVCAPPGTSRDQRQRLGRELLIRELSTRAGGDALARRNIVVIDGVCPDGRELIEKIFGFMRDEQAPTEA